jgi:exosortase/archaeosortase family protein
MSNKKEKKSKIEQKKKLQLARKEMLRQFKPLILAVAAWAAAMMVFNINAFREDLFTFFVNLTINSVILLGKITFLNIESSGYPYISVAGYKMAVIMECTAYHFYIFVIFLSLFSPVSWKQRLITLSIFVPAVFLINSLRFITMGYIGKYFLQHFHNVHDYLWNILFGFLVFMIWVWRYNVSMPENLTLEIEKK